VTLPVDATAELRGLRQAVESLTTKLGELVRHNAELQERLRTSEALRQDLAAQTAHIVELLAQARKELRALRPAAG
jgi:chromosome segregation ATPase